MQYFRAVCKYNNITRAAAELHITQPSISNAIKDLEEELGVQLFYRRSKGLSLTEEGRVFLEGAEDILQRCDDLARLMQELGSRNQEVKIGVPPMAGAFLFPRMFRNFHSMYPDIRLAITEHGSMHTRGLVAGGTLDAAIVADSAGADELSEELFSRIHIMDTQALFCTSVRHRLASHAVVDVGTIRDEPLVLFREDAYLTTAVKKLYEEQDALPNVILYSGQLHTIKEMVADGGACSVLLSGVLSEQDGICGIPFHPGIMTSIQLIWNKNRPLNSNIARFIDFTRAYCQEQNMGGHSE